MYKLKISISTVALGLILSLLAVGYINKLENLVVEREKKLLAKEDGGPKGVMDRWMSERVKVQDFIANLVQESPIPIYMAELIRQTDAINSLVDQAYKQYPGKGDKDEKGRAGVVRASELPATFVDDVMKEMESRWGNRYWPKKGDKEEFRKKEIERFVKCATIGLDQCEFEYTFNNFQLYVNQKIQSMNERCRVMIISKDGVGLADSKDWKWSQDTDYAKTHPLVDKVIKSHKSHRGIEVIKDEYYMVYARPLFYKNTFIGVTEVGDPIDSQLLTTWSKFTDTDIIAFIKTDKIKVIASTITEMKIQQLARGDAVTDRNFIWGDYILKGEGAPQITIRFAQSVDKLTRDYYNAKIWILIIGVVLTLIVLFLMAWFYKDFVEPFVILDQGVHEIINGNFDYEFPLDFKEELARSLSNSLSLMTLVLQGKPLPEEELGKGWDEELDEDVELSDDDKLRLLNEPRESYFRRLYKEYKAAKEKVGDEVEGNFNEFTKKIIRIENAFKKKTGAKEVRLVVVVKGKDVALSPITYTDEEIKRYNEDESW